MTSHFAAAIETPATPRAPKIAATIATTKNTTASSRKSPENWSGGAPIPDDGERSNDGVSLVPSIQGVDVPID